MELAEATGHTAGHLRPGDASLSSPFKHFPRNPSRTRKTICMPPGRAPYNLSAELFMETQKTEEKVHPGVCSVYGGVAYQGTFREHNLLSYLVPDYRETNEPSYI